MACQVCGLARPLVTSSQQQPSACSYHQYSPSVQDTSYGATVEHEQAIPAAPPHLNVGHLSLLLLLLRCHLLSQALQLVCICWRCCSRLFFHRAHGIGWQVLRWGPSMHLAVKASRQHGRDGGWELGY